MQNSEFLGLRQPCLALAAEFLLSRYVQGTTADLRTAIVVVPGGRAGRRLLEILVEQCEPQGLALTPPQIETAGHLPEQLYLPKWPFASDLTQRLVWAETLRGAPAEQLTPVVPRPPPQNELTPWIELGELVRRQHLELAAEGLDFGAVVQIVQQRGDLAESRRWSVLHRLQQDYLRRLDELELWDIQTARLVAVQKRECATDRDIVLVGMVDLSITLRKMLDQVADKVTSLIFAPHEWRDRFDEYGCLIPSAWTNTPIAVGSEHVLLVDGPAEQAIAVQHRIASFAGKYRADEIVVGVPDEDLIPDIQRVLASAGVTARWGPGSSLLDSPPARLLRVVERYLDRFRSADFAALLRHTDVTTWLATAGIRFTALDQLDKYFNEHFPSRLDGHWLAESPGRIDELRAAWAKIHRWLEPLAQSPQPLAEWPERIDRLLVELYAGREFDSHIAGDRIVLAACETIREVLLRHAQIPTQLVPKVSAGTAIRWLLDDLRSETLAAAPDVNSIELLGWLELTLDDAPALIVTSLNEGFVPSSVNSDLFLPNSLRQELGIVDNQCRYARDAYALSVLVAVRESLQLILARRNRDGDPLAPSRLLFATDPEEAARRALEFFRPPVKKRVTAATTKRSRQRTAAPSIEASQPQIHLEIPKPRPLSQPVQRLNVTGFRDYLACPYRFYLRHVLKLKPLDDSNTELDGKAFGSLAHEVLRRFGASKDRDATDAEIVAGVFEHELNQFSQRQYGKHPLPAVLVQIEQLRLRLRALAKIQAEWAQQGWRIEATELSPQSDRAATLVVDGEPFELRGRLDRIDAHHASGARVIWDYKTSESGLGPDKTHFAKGEWIDLQLPLYRHLARALGFTGPMRLGYILLPKDINRVGMAIAEWEEEQLSAADATAADVIRAIRREQFWPPKELPAGSFDDYAAICQANVLT